MWPAFKTEKKCYNQGMDHLPKFLLVTATQPWEEWYHSTRLIFADWCEEQLPTDAEAQVLRGLEVVVADEIANPDLHNLDSWFFRPNQLLRESKPEHIALDLHEPLGQWLPVWGGWRNGTYHCSASSNRTFTASKFRVRVEADHEVQAPYVVRSGQGQWFGTLSTARARRDCRRRVLAMFPDTLVEPWEQAIGPVQAPRLIPPEVEPSPRWVPNAQHAQDTLAGAGDKGGIGRTDAHH